MHLPTLCAQLLHLEFLVVISWSPRWRHQSDLFFHCWKRHYRVGAPTNDQRRNNNGLCTLTSASNRGNHNYILKEWEDIFIPYIFWREDTGPRRIFVEHICCQPLFRPCDQMKYTLKGYTFGCRHMQSAFQFLAVSCLLYVFQIDCGHYFGLCLINQTF